MYYPYNNYLYYSLKGTGKISEKDILAVAKTIGTLEDVALFYTRLGMTENEITGAEQEANTTNPDMKARKVLLKWRQSKGKAATRHAIIVAMEAEKWTHSIETIQEEWNKQSNELNN